MGRLRMGPKGSLNLVKASISREGAFFKQPVDLSGMVEAVSKDLEAPAKEIIVERIVEVYKDRPIEVIKEVIREVEKRVEVPVEVIKYQEVEKRVEVPVEVLKEVEVTYIQYKVPHWARWFILASVLEAVFIAIMLGIK